MQSMRSHISYLYLYVDMHACACACAGARRGARWSAGLLRLTVAPEVHGAKLRHGLRVGEHHARCRAAHGWVTMGGARSKLALAKSVFVNIIIDFLGNVQKISARRSPLVTCMCFAYGDFAQ